MSLLDVDHRFYCLDVNRHCPKHHQEFDSWSDFMDEWEDVDMDLNFVFRWDISQPLYEGDLRSLHLFVIQQRIGAFMPVVINNIDDSDEPSIKAWLSDRWNDIREIWEPFSNEAKSLEQKV